MREIKLVNSTETTLVDDEDYITLSKYKWRLHLVSGRKYAMRIKHDKMHRYILPMAGNNDIDHIDHNGLNNQKSNLRVCSRSQNNQNQRPKKAKYKGVSFLKRRASTNKPYMARITYDKVEIFLGYFSTSNAAALAYNEAALKYFKEFACINTIKEMNNGAT